jgi:O-antigen/teichoic acid export membrane protein
MNLNIAVVIPTYNRLELLQQAIQSVREQTHPVHEIIVVDDGSNDRTVEWCSTQKDLQIVELHRAGPSVARNRGVQVARSDWIAFLDSDDFWMKNHIEKFAEVLRKIPDTRFFVSNFIITDATLNPVMRNGRQGFVAAFPAFRSSTKLFSLLFQQRESQMTWHGHAARAALFGNWMQPSGLIVRADFFESLGGFNEALWRCEDMDLLMRCVARSPVTVSMCPTYLWRQQQSDSLAADRHVLALKAGGLQVMSIEGLKIVCRRPALIFLWMASVIAMTTDLCVTFCLRKISKHRVQPIYQTAVQAGVSLLNICVPVVIGRMMNREDFGLYRNFGLFLSSASALSLTSGLWSLIPYWNAHRDKHPQAVSLAWKLQCGAALACSLILLLISPISSNTPIISVAHSGYALDGLSINVILACSVCLLLPAVFLEQRLNIHGDGFIAAVLIACIEVLKIAGMLALILLGQPLAAVLIVIALSLLIRTACLKAFSDWRFARQNKNQNFMHDVVHKAPTRLADFQLILQSAWPVGVSAALVSLASQFDRFFLSSTLGAAQFAVVAAGSLSFPIIQLLEQSVVQSSLVQMSQSLRDNRMEDVTQSLRHIIELIFKKSLPYSVFIICYAPEILQLLFAGRFPESGPIMRLYAVSNLLCCIPADVLSRAQGQSLRILSFSLMTVSLTIVAVLLGFAFGQSRVGGHVGIVHGNGSVLCAIGFGLLAALTMRIVQFVSDLRRLNIVLADLCPRADVLIPTLLIGLLIACVDLLLL